MNTYIDIPAPAIAHNPGATGSAKPVPIRLAWDIQVRVFETNTTE